MEQEFPLQITLQAFLLRDDIPPEGKIRPQAGDGAQPGDLQEPLRTAALETGLSKMKRSFRISYSLPALEATEYAKEQGKYKEFHKACYRAYWEESEDIGDFQVLQAIATGCGLNWAELENRLLSRQYAEAVQGQFRTGVKMGVRAIPAFVIGNNGFTGAAPYETFRLAAERAMPLVKPEEQSP